jgi:hypothetical protein
VPAPRSCHVRAGFRMILDGTSDMTVVGEALDEATGRLFG